MPDEDKTFNGSLVLDLRILWRHMHTLYGMAAFRSFGIIRIRISDPRSVWIMVHQTNRWIHGQSGFTGSFDAPWSRQISDHWSGSGSPRRNAAYIILFLLCQIYLLPDELLMYIARFLKSMPLSPTIRLPILTFVKVAGQVSLRMLSLSPFIEYPVLYQSWETLSFAFLEKRIYQTMSEKW